MAYLDRDTKGGVALSNEIGPLEKFGFLYVKLSHKVFDIVF
jgi:hypothetical protein